MKFITSTALLILLLNSCKFSEDTQVQLHKNDLVKQYVKIGDAAYTDALYAADSMRVLVDRFVATPSAQGLDSCRQAWLRTRRAYIQTEVFRFIGGPIDEYAGIYGHSLDGSPRSGSLIDYMVDSPDSGLINDLEGFPEINADILLSANGPDGTGMVFTGFHAIEFLLWGQDQSVNSGGDRPYTDFILGGTAHNQERRGMYLKTVTVLLVDQLGKIASAWQNDAAYRKSFDHPDNLNQSLTLILTGMGKLTKGELAGRRLGGYLEGKNPEAEHSPFSDNTQQDLIWAQRGIENVYFGRFTRLDGSTFDGSGWDDLLNVALGGINKGVVSKLDISRQSLEGLPTPMDQSVLSDPNSYYNAINALRSQADQFVILGHALGINLLLPEKNG